MLASLLLSCKDPDPENTRTWEDYDPLPYVDPLIGTGGPGAQTTGLNPGAAVPFGMTLTGPDTRDKSGNVLPFYHYGGYHYDDTSIDAFSHTHSHGMGVVDFGGIAVMPRGMGFDPAFVESKGRTAPFDHAAEQASPGTYRVTLSDDGTQVEIAATTRGASHRYRFDPAKGQGASPAVIFDLGHALPGVEIGEESWVEIAGGEITGFQRLSGGYSARIGGLLTSFVARIEPEPVQFGSWSGAPDAILTAAGESRGEGSASGLWMSFPPGTTEVTLKVALSVTDLEGARANLDSELIPFDHDTIVAQAEEAWREALAPVRIWGTEAGEEDLRTRFHTAHYHTMLMPRRYDDVDGRYRGLDGEIHAAESPYYSDFSLWDTYRTVHPFYTLLHPSRQREMLVSLVQMVKDGGSLPRWPLGHGYTGGMVGSPASIVMSDSAQKGLAGWDQEIGFAASFAQATSATPFDARGGVEEWNTIGYVSSQSGAGASLTLEYAWADEANTRWAAMLGRETEQGVLSSLADNWRNTWDAEHAFFQSRNPDGLFTEFEGEHVWSEDYVEGNPWHYLWMVPYDVQGMIEVQHGGDAEAFAARYAQYWRDVAAEPEDNLPDDWYWHGNEPVMHYAWLGSLAGRTDLTAEAVRWVATHRYGLTPQDGLDGNDDAGTLSAWYLWAALGFYPISGTVDYAVGSPLVTRAELQTEGGTLLIEATDSSETAIYPISVEASGERREGRLSHEDLLGGHIVFEMSSSPGQ